MIEKIENHPSYGLVYYSYLKNRGKTDAEILRAFDLVAGDRK